MTDTDYAARHHAERPLPDDLIAAAVARWRDAAGAPWAVRIQTRHGGESRHSRHSTETAAFAAAADLRGKLRGSGVIVDVSHTAPDDERGDVIDALDAVGYGELADILRRDPTAAIEVTRSQVRVIHD